MARKAGFYGECQVCGNVQKLPGSLLSLHGYEVKWHMFVGDCTGSRCLPFEQDKTVAIAAMFRAVSQRANHLAMAKTLRVMATEPTYYVMVNRNPPNTPSWKRNDRLINSEKVTFVVKTLETSYGHKYEAVVAVAKDGFEQTLSGYRGTDPLAAAQYYRERDAENNERTARSLVSYIEWQTKRIDAWELKDLKPVADVVAEEQAVKDNRKAEKKAARVAKMEKRAEYLRKQIAKYEKLVPATVRESLKGMDRRAMYDLHLTYPTAVGDTLHSEWERVNEPGQRGIYDNPYLKLEQTIHEIEKEVAK